jgi:hypothetical protein
MMRVLIALYLTACSVSLFGQELKVTESGTVNFIPSRKGSHQSMKWVIYSDRNSPVARMTDRSAHAPEDFVDRPVNPGTQIWFPVIDVALRPGFRLIAEFEEVRAGDSVCFNGNFQNICSGLKSRMIYTQHLEHWENQLYVESESALLKSAAFEIPVVTEEFSLKPLSAYWKGSVEVWGKDKKGNWEKLDSEEVSIGQKDELVLSKESTITKDLVLQRLAAASEYLVNSRNLNPYSPTYGGLYLFYDLEWDTYRRSDWMWSYGPSIQVLLEASKLRNLSDTYSSETFMTSARQVAEASLRFQQTNENHPAHGLVMCRYDPRTDSPHGAEGFYSPADSWFLAGWGWMPYYNHTGDKRFLDATILMTQGIDRILGPDADREPQLIEQDYLMKAGKWKNWTMDESGFGMKGAEELYQVTKDPYHRDVGEEYITGLLAHLERPDGLWDRTWHRNDSLHADNGWPVAAPRGTPVLIKTSKSTRGLGWAMIGLLASHGVMPEGDVYLKKAIKLSDHLIEAQAEDGHWDFLFDGSGYPGEIGEKGTALWCLLFYQLYEYTKDERHLNTARKALLWCVNNQYTGPEESPAYGGIMGKNRESGVVYRRFSPLICSYTVGWYGLALLEELKLQDRW